MKTFFSVSILMLSCSFGFSSPNCTDLTQCPAPSKVTMTSQTNGSVSFDWDDCGCEFTAYRIYFVRSGQTSSEYSTTSSNISFSGLSAGMYQFHFYTMCGETVSAIIIEDVTMG